MRLFLGIDIGTYESKGVLADDAGAIIASAAVPHRMESPQPGWAEHDAEKTWWGDFVRLSRALLDDPARRAALEAVSVSAIAPCCLPLDAAGQPLRKAMLYGVDVRASAEIDEINRFYGEDTVFRRCGTPVTTQSAAAKILWLRRHEPEIYARTARFVTGSSYLVEKLTGRCAIDHYTAAAFAPLYDVERARWIDPDGLFDDTDRLADILWTDEIAGRVTAEASAATGIPVGTPVTAGTADAAAEAVSAGVLDPGDMMLMYGSSMFLIHVTDRDARDMRLWSAPYLFPGTHCVTAGMSCAGTITRWFADELARDVQKDAFATLAAEAARTPKGADGLVMLPYFSGERTPINDPLAQGVLFGLNLHHTRGHIYRACLEGVACGIAQHFDIFRDMSLSTRAVMAVGGGTKNPVWLQAVSDVAHVSQTVPSVSLGAAYGDALLAALAIGAIPDRRALAALIRPGLTVSPDASSAPVYARTRALYDALYPATKPLMHRP